MNYSIVRNVIGKIMILIAILMLLPLIIALIYSESIRNIISFVIPIVLLLIIGYLLNLKKPKQKTFTAKEGFAIVGLSWVVMSLFGCLPFVISKEIPMFYDAFFEISSGFTTTGASVLVNVESLSHSMLFWRSFSHWIGGMGILVFILAFIPESNEGSSMFILRAESPGPQVGKLVSKMKVSARILYIIYVILTLIEIILLWVGPDNKMDLFSSMVYTFGTAGTGGFSISSTSLEYYSHYSQYVIAIFMILFGINFNIYYLILIGKLKEAIKNEELRWYLIIIALSVLIIGINIYSIYQNVSDTFRLSLFQVASIVSTTGYSTANFDIWPNLSKSLLLLLMLFGSCAGSTAGGVKMSRIIILFKSCKNKIKRMINPRKVEIVSMDNKIIEDDVVASVYNFFTIYIFIFIICALLISIDNYDIITNTSASLACISNIGPGLGLVGPYGSFNIFSPFSKIVLSFEMIAGRLELFPILMLFNIHTWKKR